MKSIIPSISVENCKEALEFYKQIFGGEIERIQMSDGIEMFKGQEGKVLHSELHVNDHCIMYFTDYFGPKATSTNVQLVIEMDSQAQIEEAFTALSKDGTVVFPLQKTFWGAMHAVINDKYNVTWGLNFTM